MSAELSAVLRRAAALAGQALPAARLAAAERAAAALPDGADATARFRAAWSACGLEGEPRAVRRLERHVLPAIAWSAAHGWLLVQARGADGSWSAADAAGRTVAVDGAATLQCVSIPARPAAGREAPRAIRLVREALWQRRRVFGEALAASVLINVLALAISLYTMQVYNRVIPNQGFDTLWVLSVGVLVAIGLEFLLRAVRSLAIDRASGAIDRDLSDWFFARLLGIRMEARPQSVGSLAAQVKGLEHLRGALTSAPTFVLVDAPFGVLFMAVIFVIAGPLAVVPLVALPACLAAGLAFQRLIDRGARTHHAHAHRKTGLLVEAIDGAESLKAAGADWKIQARWHETTASVADSDYRMRRLSALAQQLTATLQQLGYVAMVGYGAYLAADNRLTLGALIACTIIANRALAPVVQLPAVMLQWAHARAALAGLDAIARLPNEGEQHAAIVPPGVSGRLALEGVRFAYAPGRGPAMAVRGLVLNAGEKTCVLGGVGSGKSTLLKLACGLYRPDEGRVTLDGVDMALVAPAFLRDGIGFLPQEPRLFGGTLRDNLLLGLPDPGDEAILDAARRTGLFELISGQAHGLALPITEGGRGISGGQRQLVVLTRLLLQSPRIWVLDEPTNAMDAGAEARVARILRDAHAGGATLLVATHKAALIPLFDRVIVLQGGRVACDGPREQVLPRLVSPAPSRDVPLKEKIA